MFVVSMEAIKHDFCENQKTVFCNIVSKKKHNCCKNTLFAGQRMFVALKRSIINVLKGLGKHARNGECQRQ
jgi:hypothetical protein